MDRVFHIHAGAHRTGTSSFQLCLHVNRMTLRRAGYDAAYPGRDGIPTGLLSLQLPAPRHGAEKQEQFAERVRRNLAEHRYVDTGQMILSEENIPGRMLHFFEGRFYPAAEARLKTLRAGLEGRVGTLLYVVRDYAGLYRSAWRKRAEEHEQPPFASQVEALARMDRGWPELVVQMRAYLAPERLVIVPYEARGSSIDLLWRLVPGVSGLVEPRRHLNRSVTEAGLAVLQQRFRTGETLEAADRAAIVAQYADDKTPQGLTEYPADIKAALDARYAQDLERLKAMPDVTFLR